VDRSLLAVIFGTFTLRFSTGLTGAMLAFYLARLGYDAITFAVFGALFYAAELVLSPFFGYLSDRIGHHRVMQLGPLFGIVAVILTWAFTDPYILGGTRLLEGASTAASVPSILGFIAATTARDELLRGKAVARFEAATLAGLLVGFVAAGPLFQTLGSVAFLVNAVIYLGSLVIYRFGVSAAEDPDPAPGERVGNRGLGRYLEILRGTHVWLLAPTWIAINAVLGLYTSQTIFQLVRKPDPRFADQLLMGGFEPIQVSLGLGLGGLLFFAGLFYWGNRFKSLRRTTIILYGIVGGVVLVAAAIAINHSIGAPDLVRAGLLAPAVGGLFVLAGATPAAIGLLADVTEAYPDDRGAIMGLYSVFLGLGQIGGNLVGGIAAETRGIDGILVASVVLLLIAIVPLFALRRYEHYVGGPSSPAVLTEDQPT
jgi:MFS family permease